MPRVTSQSATGFEETRASHQKGRRHDLLGDRILKGELLMLGQILVLGELVVIWDKCSRQTFTITGAFRALRIHNEWRAARDVSAD